MTRTIVVDGLPVVPADRQARFFTFFIQKFVGQRGFDVSEKDIDMPLDSNGSSKGFLFLTLPTAAQAADAVTRLSDSFDKKHSTTCVLMSAIPDIQNIQDEFEAPEDDSADFVPSEHRKGWLADPQGRDQMAVLRDRTLQIIWNHKGHKLDLDHTRDVRLIRLLTVCSYSFSYAFAELDGGILTMVTIRSYLGHSAQARPRTVGRAVL